LTFIADDEDNNLHLRDAELVINAASGAAPVFSNDKIPWTPQTEAVPAEVYPEVNKAINNKFPVAPYLEL
jgi:hypothetical protein